MVSMCKSYEVDNTSTLGYGSDEDLFEESTVTETSPDTSRDEEAALTKVERVVQQLRFVLTGIPPPPTFTIPQLDVDGMLKLWTANQQFVVNGQPKSPDDQITSILQSELRLAESGKWPEVTQSHYFAVNYNLGRLCEEVERLQARVQERFVGCETSSCVNSLAGQLTVPLTASAKKRARTRGRSWGQQSPGRRLSYLARRRHTFSSANLAQSGKAVQGGGGRAPDKRQIVLALNRKTANRLKLRKEANKTQIAPTKKPLSNEQKTTNPKRALFQSPDEKKRKPFGRVKPSPNTLRMQQSKHLLWPNDQVAAQLESPSEKLNENGKRNKMSPAGSTMTPRKKCYRSLSFSEGNSATEKPPQHQGTRTTNLGKTHTHKMLWAVSNALRDKGIKREHQYFRQWASELFKLCSRLWLSSGGDFSRQGSTSENMLTLANQFVNDIMARAGRGGDRHRTAAALSAEVSNRLASVDEKLATVSQGNTLDKQCGVTNPILMNGVSTTTTKKKKNSEQSEPCFKVPLNENDSLSNFTNIQSENVDCSSSIVQTVETSIALGLGHVSYGAVISHVTNKETAAGFRFVKFGSQSSASDQENYSPSTSRTVAQGTSDSLKLELLNESQFTVAPGDKSECLSEMISQWRRLVPARQEGIDDVCSTQSNSQVTAAKLGASNSSWSDDGDESCIPFVAPELFDILDTSISTDLSCCSAISEATQSSSRHTN